MMHVREMENKVIKNIGLLFAALLIPVAVQLPVSCTVTTEYSVPAHENEVTIFKECRSSIFYHSSEGLARVVKWHTISNIGDTTLRNYFFNIAFAGYPPVVSSGDSLKIGNIIYDTQGTDIFVPGSVWTAVADCEGDYSYRIECLGENEWRVTVTLDNKNSQFDNPTMVEGDFVIAYREPQNSDNGANPFDGEFRYLSGSGKVFDSMPALAQRGVMEVYINEPVNAVITEDGYDYFDAGVYAYGDDGFVLRECPVSIYGGAVSIIVNVFGNPDFSEQIYYVELDMSSRYEQIVRIYHNGNWNDYAI